MKLKSARLVDVLSHLDSKVEFGRTLTVFAGTSDSGKSTVLRGLRQTFRNEPAGIDLLRHAAKRGACSEVDVSCVNDDGATFTIKRVRGKSRNEYAIDGQPILAFGQDVPEEVSKLLRLSPYAFQVQSDNNFMLSANAGTVSKILSSAVGLDQIDAAFSEVRSRKTENDTALRFAENDLVRESAASLLFAGMPEANAALVEWEAAAAAVAETRADLDAMVAAHNALTVMWPDCSDRIREATVALGKLAYNETESEIVAADLADAERHIALLAAIPADAGKSRVTAMAMVNRFAAMTAAREATETELDDIDQLLTDVDSIPADAVKEIAAATEYLTRAVKVKTDADAEWDLLTKMEFVCTQASVLRNDATAAIEEATRALAELVVTEDGTLGEVDTLELMDRYIGEWSTNERETITTTRMLAVIKSELTVYAAQHPVCPECGAEQQHWHTQTTTTTKGT